MSNTALEQHLTAFWAVYTSDDSWLPFILPATLWLSCWAYYKSTGKDFGRWYTIHTLHHVGAIGFASLSLYFQDDTIFNERIGILWSMPYFIVDILECTMTGHYTYTAHGAICLGLGLSNYHLPLMRSLRMNSKASYIESSSIILYQVKQYRNPMLFGIFSLVFTLCRIVWVPIMGYQVVYAEEGGLEFTHPIVLALGAFYGLQVHWWIKIINILIKGSVDNDDDGRKKKKLNGDNKDK